MELGGGEVEPGIYVTVLEELARHDASVAWNLFVANSAALIAPYMDDGAAAKVFSNPRTVVAWAPPHKGLAEAAARATRVGGCSYGVPLGAFRVWLETTSRFLFRNA